MKKMCDGSDWSRTCIDVKMTVTLRFALAHTKSEHAFVYRNKEDSAIAITQGDRKRDYYILVENVLLVGGADKPISRYMDDAVRDLEMKHKGATAAMYGGLQYIILIATAGNLCQFYALDLHQGGKPLDLGVQLQVI